MATLDPKAVSVALKSLERAAARLAKASDEMESARAARDEALRAVAAAGVPKRQVAKVSRQHLEQRGWDEERIAAAKLSEGTVMAVLRPNRQA